MPHTKETPARKKKAQREPTEPDLEGRGCEPPPTPLATPGTPPPLNPTDASTGRVAPPTHGKCRN